MRCFFATDLHGKNHRYTRLFAQIRAERPAVVFLGGDLLPHAMVVSPEHPDYLRDFIISGLRSLRAELGAEYPEFVVILGNDDPRGEEQGLREAEAEGLLHYAQGRRLAVAGLVVYGYAFVPPSPFPLKDWEKYDVSRFVDPGCTPPTEGFRSVEPEHRPESSTIREDLDALMGDDDLSEAVLLFHCPPYDTALDRAALDGRYFDHAPIDVHIGSIAIRRLIETAQPRLTLHGHVHEAARLTGTFVQRIGRTFCLGAAHDGPELCLVDFDPRDPDDARRRLL